MLFHIMNSQPFQTNKSVPYLNKRNKVRFSIGLGSTNKKKINKKKKQRISFWGTNDGFQLSMFGVMFAKITFLFRKRNMLLLSEDRMQSERYETI